MTKQHYTSSQESIYNSIKARKKKEIVSIQGINFILLPNVFPSHEFRAAEYLPKSLSRIVKDKKILDMGCGLGMVGIYSLKHGAAKVVQCDINSEAVKNARLNRKLHNYNKKLDIYTSDCFDKVPNQKFDLIIFNPPFFSFRKTARDMLEKSLLDSNFETIKKFLSQAPKYISNKTKIIIVSSNRVNTKKLEEIFDTHGFSWKIWKYFNQEQKYDNRLYLLKLKM